jgi:hypothetical protein
MIFYINDNFYSPHKLSKLIEFSIFLGKEKGKYNIEWLKFLTEKGIEEFPIFSEIEKYKEYKELLDKLEK